MGITFTIERRTSNLAYGTIKWPEYGLSSGAVSGPYGKKELPEGLYHAKRNGLLDRDGTDAFCDSLMNCWFQLLSPQFSTERDQLGIHPEGNKIGTQGCIGLIEADTKSWYEAFKSIPNGSYTTVEVFDRAE